MEDWLFNDEDDSPLYGDDHETTTTSIFTEDTSYNNSHLDHHNLMTPVSDYSKDYIGDHVNGVCSEDPGGYFGEEQEDFSETSASSYYAPSSPSTNCSSLQEDHDDDIDAIFPEDISPTSADAATYNPVAPADMDALVAKQMAELSMKDREKVYFDIHGVADEIPETPEFIDNKLQEFDYEFKQLISPSSSSNPDWVKAYELAYSLSPDYVSNRAFRLSFLRADLFDPAQAAQRFARHWQAKLELFGPEALVQSITQDEHLTPDSIEALYSGLSQYLPLRDRAGRLVVVSFYHPNHISLHAKLQRTFYMSMVSSEDEDTQRKGRIAIGYLAGQHVEGRPRNDWQVAKLLNALPVRMEAIHLCHDTKTIWSPIFAVFKYVATLFTRLRIREHYGSHQECLMSLQTFGIPIKNCFPLEEDKNGGYAAVSNVEHSIFWQKQRNLERLRKRQADFPGESVQASLQQTMLGMEAGSESMTSSSAVASSTATSFATAPSMKPVEQRPATAQNTNDKNNNNKSQSSSKKQKEKKPEAPLDPLASPIFTPALHDVLLGRGKGFYQHTGNIRFRHFIETRSQAYDQAMTLSEKKTITQQVIELVEQEGGRFLKDDKTCGWVQVTHETARQKVAHVFRSLRESTPDANAAGSASGSRKTVLAKTKGSGTLGEQQGPVTSKRMRR